MPRPIVVKAGSEAPGVSYSIPACLERLRSRCDVIVTEDEDEATLLKAVVGATALMMTYGKVSRAVIEAGQPTLKAVIKLGTGIDSIDCDAARELGVTVANCPGYAQRSVAECAFMLMILCFKKFGMVQNAVRKHGWATPTEHNKSSELFGKTVGLVPLGRINTQLATMCRGFGMRLVAYSPNCQADRMREQGIEKANTLQDLASQADIVSVCLPLNDKTRHIIDRDFLRHMKTTAYLINVGRGATVDEFAVVEALEQRTIAGFGLDVLSKEPLTRENHPLSKLLDMENVIISPHLAAWTKEAWDALQDDVVKHVFDLLDGKPLGILSTDPRLANQAGCIYPLSR